MNTRLKEVRRLKGWSQAKLAEELGISQSVVQSYELKRRNPSEAYIHLFCDKLEISEDWLRTGNGEMFKPETQEAYVAKIARQMLKEDEDSIVNQFIKVVAGLSEEQLEVFLEVCKQFAQIEKEDRP